MPKTSNEKGLSEFELKNEYQAEFKGSFRKSKIRSQSSGLINFQNSVCCEQAKKGTKILPLSYDTTLGEIALGAAVEQEKKIIKKYVYSTFQSMKCNPSAAVSKIKINRNAIESQAENYKRLYTTNPTAPPSAGAVVHHSIQKHLSSPGIKRPISAKLRPKSAPASSLKQEVYEKEAGKPNSDKLNSIAGRLNETYQTYPPSLPGQIPPRIHQTTQIQIVRQRKSNIKNILNKNDPNNSQKLANSTSASIAVTAKKPISETLNSLTESIKENSNEIKKDKNILDETKKSKPSWAVAKEKIFGGEKSKYSQFRKVETALKHLSILTDTDVGEDEIRNSLEELIEASRFDSKFTSTTLYDSGAVNILLDLLPRISNNWELQYRASELLKLLADSNELTYFTIHKKNGIASLLQTIEVLGKVAIDNTQSKKSSPWAKVTQLANIVRLKQGSLLENKSAATSVVALNQNLSNKVPIISITEEEEDFEKIKNDYSVFHDPSSLVHGLLNNYFDPEFTQNLDRMDRNHKTQVINHLLSLFEKVDKILAATMYVSLEVDLIQAMEQIQWDATELVQAQSVKVYLLDEETKELYFPQEKENSSRSEEIRFLANTGIAGWSANNDETINIKSDASENELFDPEVDLFDNKGIEANSILCVPIKHPSGKVLGVLEAINKINSISTGVLAEKASTVNGEEENNNFFSEEDENLLKILSKQSGLVINNAHIYESMLQTQKKVQVLLDTTKSLGSTLNIDELIRMIMDSAKNLLTADRCSLFLADGPDNKSLLAHVQGPDSIQDIRINSNQGIAGYVFTSGESVNIPDAYSDSRFNPAIDKQTGYLTRNILCMPIKNVSGVSIGVTQMINKHSGPFGHEDESILGSFSAQAAVAIEKSYLFKQTEDIRNYLESILSSITSCVITLNESLQLMTINRDWVLNALNVGQDFMRANSILNWLGDSNPVFLDDINKVLNTNIPIYSAEYSLQSTTDKKTTKFVNYQIMPLIGNVTKGLVLVLEDISSEKRAIMTLGRYMSPALAKQVMEEDGSQLGGKRKKVAILFSDIRSFTSLTESMEPHMVVELLNHHFSDAVNAILAEQGILDKYIGDAVMAVFGVPFVNPDDSIHACNAALRMRASLKIANEFRVSNGLNPIKIGIGINTGMVLSGNIGSEKRMEFSCIGDAVNLASRIEGLTKNYNTSILITEYTKNETGDMFWTREIDTVVVTGRSNPVKIYELIGRKPSSLNASNNNFSLENVINTPHEEVLHQLPMNLEIAMSYYAKGLELYRSAMFMEAAENFNLAIGE
ncbi:hypothetical protein HDU92_001448 [Lobulomyces angularis]|nr:hypothetical protein HDU92_001448 [Lobulomyces angularis]